MSIEQGHTAVRAAAAVQTTAEQLILEARDLSQELQSRRSGLFSGPRIDLVDQGEVDAVLKRERERHEVRVSTRGKRDAGAWLRFAHFEEAQGEYGRARGVYERALVANYEEVSVWLNYLDMELRQQCLGRARNLLDRATLLLPKVAVLWFRYVYVEELVGDYLRVREVFARWLQHRPCWKAWTSCIRFELKCREHERARELYKRLVLQFNGSKAWLKWAKFEESLSAASSTAHRVRDVFEQALELLPAGHARAGTSAQLPDELVQLHLAYADFEARWNSVSRAREQYRRAVDQLASDASVLQQLVYDRYVAFERQHGDRQSVHELVYVRRRFQFERRLAAAADDWDAWFDYARLEQRNLAVHGSAAPDQRPQLLQRVRTVFARAAAAPPPAQHSTRRHWQRYVWLHLAAAVFEETGAQDAPAARHCYQRLLALLPHQRFSFARVWIAAAHFELRQRALKSARRLLGTALAQCPARRVFAAYVDVERQLGEYQRCRKIYEKMLQTPARRRSAAAWLQFADFEAQLAEDDRARRLYELALEQQQQLDAPESVWRAYLSFELARHNHPAVRRLYERLVVALGHVHVWLNYAQFETSVRQLDLARAVYQRCWDLVSRFTANDAADARTLLHAWLHFEQRYGTPPTLDHVRALERQLAGPTPTSTPAASSLQLSLVEKARRWKLQQQQQKQES